MGETVDYVAMGKRIRQARKKCGLTQAALGEKCRVSGGHIGHVETNHGKVSLEAMVAIANALDVSLDSLLCDSLTSSKPVFENELAELLSQATPKQVKLIAELTKVILRDEFKLRDLERNEE